MSKPTSPIVPTAAELAVLQLLWSSGPLSVREVHDGLDADRPVVYTTVLKTMQVMHERGLLTRESAGRKHIYAAAIEREPTQDGLLDTFLARAFGGSAKGLVMRALGKHTPSPEELDELKAYIAELEAEQTANPTPRDKYADDE